MMVENVEIKKLTVKEILEIWYYMKGLKKNWPIREVKNESDVDDVIVTLLFIFERCDVFHVIW